MENILENYLEYLNEQPIYSTTDTKKIGNKIAKDIVSGYKNDGEEETFDDIDLD